MTSLLSAKLAMKYAGSAIESMKAVANAAKQRSLADFNVVSAYFNFFIREFILFELFFRLLGVTKMNYKWTRW